jgi:hypothetical protein
MFKLTKLNRLQTIILIMFTLTCFSMLADTYRNDSLTAKQVSETKDKEIIVRYKYISVVDHKEACIDVLVPKIVN